MYTCVLACAFMCVSAFQMVDTNLQLYYQAITNFFLVICFQLTQCDVTGFIYNVVSNNMAHISLHVLFSTLYIGRCSHNENM